MEKDFDGWNARKKNIHALWESPNLYLKERDIWWCALGVNIGYEEDGKNDAFERPVLIFRIFSKRLAWIIPLTSKYKIGTYYYQIEYENHPYALILSQLRLISTKRLRRKIYTLPSEQFKAVREKMRALI